MDSGVAQTQGTPLAVQLPKKISAKDSAIRALMPQRMRA